MFLYLHNGLSQRQSISFTCFRGVWASPNMFWIKDYISLWLPLQSILTVWTILEKSRITLFFLRHSVSTNFNWTVLIQKKEKKTLLIVNCQICWAQQNFYPEVPFLNGVYAFSYIQLTMFFSFFCIKMVQ